VKKVLVEFLEVQLENLASLWTSLLHLLISKVVLILMTNLENLR
jgi:hypothetical protein